MQSRSRHTVLPQFSFQFLTETQSRPNLISYPTLVAANDGLSNQLHNATLLINWSLPPNTLKASRIAWNAYGKFLATCLGRGTGHIKQVLAFVSYCPTHLSQSHNTVQLYLARHPAFPLTTSPWETLTVRDPCGQSLVAWHPETSAVASSKRLPISSSIFQDMSAILSRSSFGLLPSLVIQAAIYLAFYSFLWPGEFTYSGPGCQVLRRCHLAHLKNILSYIWQCPKLISPALGLTSNSSRTTTNGVQ